MIAHLQGREKAVEELGFRPRDAEWIALVALHSGFFVRSQYQRFLGGAAATARTRSRRLVLSLVERRYAAEVSRGGVRGTVCRVFSRKIYRALGAEHIRHRKDAAQPHLVRRLLSLDAVLAELNRPWLPTEGEKVGACEGLGIPTEILPRLEYGRKKGGRTVRPFAWKMPVAVGGTAARFVYTDSGGETDAELLSWGAQHARLWSALQERGLRVEVSVTSAWSARLEILGAMLAKWRNRGLRVNSGTAGLTADEAAELERLEGVVLRVDVEGLRRGGGLRAVTERIVGLRRKRSAAGADPACEVRPDAVEERLSGLPLTGSGEY